MSPATLRTKYKCLIVFRFQESVLSTFQAHHCISHMPLISGALEVFALPWRMRPPLIPGALEEVTLPWRMRPCTCHSTQSLLSLTSAGTQVISPSAPCSGQSHHTLLLA